MYDFRTQLNAGKQIEQSLDTYFSKWYLISNVDLETEKNQGIDRLFVSKVDGKTQSVEYKADFKAFSTQNIYVELSVNSDSGYQKNGWATHTQADIILYSIVNSSEVVKIFVLQPSVIVNLLDNWKGQYRNVTCQNKGYHSIGILVPTNVIEKVSDKVLHTHIFLS